MGSGYYPLERRSGAGRRLSKINAELRALLNSQGDDRYANVPDCLPSPDDNDQYDNAASDGGYVTYLYLARELIERCLEKAKCQCVACQMDGPHYSSCAVHSEPAIAKGPCSCGLS